MVVIRKQPWTTNILSKKKKLQSRQSNNYLEVTNNDIDNIPAGLPRVWYPRPLSPPPLLAGGNICIFAPGTTFMFTSNMFQEDWKPIKVRKNTHLIVRNKKQKIQFNAITPYPHVRCCYLLQLWQPEHQTENVQNKKHWNKLEY